MFDKYCLYVIINTTMADNMTWLDLKLVKYIFIWRHQNLFSHTECRIWVDFIKHFLCLTLFARHFYLHATWLISAILFMWAGNSKLDVILFRWAPLRWLFLKGFVLIYLDRFTMLMTTFCHRHGTSPFISHLVSFCIVL